ncbi:MAG: LacI family DNA-binding transcriptional regulator [Oscillospiraceae bacterium]
MVTIKEVEKLAKVSVATVSRVMNKTDNVSQETKQRVQAAIKTLSYSPNLLGRSLRRNETKRILVLLNTISNEFYSRILKGIEKRALENGYTVMICMTHGNDKLEEKYIEMIKTRLVDGAIFLTTEQSGIILKDELDGLNVVQACEPAKDFKTPTVCINNEKAAYDATCYLIELGHKKIAFLGAAGIYQSSDDRATGYKRAMNEASLPIKPEFIINEGFSYNAGARAVEKLISENNELPTACFCISDSCAAGAIRTFIKNGISVPNDMSVMGFDNTKLSQIFLPAITTVKQPQLDIGYIAMDLLLKVMRSETILNPNITLPYKIIKRESTQSISD